MIVSEFFITPTAHQPTPALTEYTGSVVFSFLNSNHSQYPQLAVQLVHLVNNRVDFGTF
ncbi:hypothetical protein PL9214290145 [Planktothrix tepida PCC 9214]|uniref:Uncharacterized protein n=1 Tax=Planktothrix tepida PCC 9214 TaxID=671072 RepID=A0A1J1LD08_9CYAN|nr:hypothetical protein PL9214290145 [Planktothrix tepida PCC 9214]